MSKSTAKNTRKNGEKNKKSANRNQTKNAAVGINRKKGAPVQKVQAESTKDILLDLIKNPFEYKRDSKYLSKTLGIICIIMAVCLLFYISGHY